MTFCAVLGAAFACDHTPQCVPGSTQTGCPCNTGGPGYAVCDPDGLDWGSCLCGVPDAGETDSAADAPAQDADDGGSNDAGSDGSVDETGAESDGGAADAPGSDE